MGDIVKWLREEALDKAGGDYEERMNEAADEIKRLRAGLRKIEHKASQYSGTTWVAVEEIAKEALGDDDAERIDRAIDNMRVISDD